MTKRPQYKKIISFCLAASALTLISLGFGHAARAESGTAVSQGFQGDTSNSALVAGAVVSLAGDGSTVVKPATVQTASSLLGVVNSRAVLALSGTGNQVQVVIAGNTPTLVSDINGTIEAGDKITSSPISGVGMKATTDTEIVGIAQQNFDAANAKSQTITDRGGKPHTIHIGTISAQINIAYYVAPSSSVLPPFLQGLANSIAGKPVSVVRILIACMLLLLASLGIFILLHTSIRSGIISIGRNPLAAHAINKGLATVGLTTLLILAFALVTTYVILAI